MFDGIHPTDAGNNAIVVPLIQNTLVAVPEPGTLGLAASAFAALTLLAARRRAK